MAAGAGTCTAPAPLPGRVPSPTRPQHCRRVPPPGGSHNQKREGKYLKQTTNYQLPSWDSEDRILRTDFNTLTEKVDTALAENADAIAAETEERTNGVAALTAQVAAKGNCTVEHQTYTGTGDAYVTLTFSSAPLLVVIMSSNLLCVAVRGSSALARNAGVGGASIGVTWGSNSMSWNGSSTDSMRCNLVGTTYCVTAVMAT